MKPNIYPRTTELRDLEPHYSAHVSAMATERLDSKAEIAEQLAWRDKRLADALAYLEVTRSNCAELRCAWSNAEVMGMLRQLETLLVAAATAEGRAPVFSTAVLMLDSDYFWPRACAWTSTRS